MKIIARWTEDGPEKQSVLNHVQVDGVEVKSEAIVNIRRDNL